MFLGVNADLTSGFCSVSEMIDCHSFVLGIILVDDDTHADQVKDKSSLTLHIGVIFLQLERRSINH